MVLSSTTTCRNSANNSKGRSPIIADLEQVRRGDQQDDDNDQHHLGNSDDDDHHDGDGDDDLHDEESHTDLPTGGGSNSNSSSRNNNNMDPASSLATTGQPQRISVGLPTTAAAETKAASWLKVLLLLILVASTTCVGFLLYSYTSQSEQARFEERFEDEASKLLEAVRGTFYQSMQALDSYVVDLVSYAEYSDSQWPYVTLPNHGVRAAKLRTLSKAFYVAEHHLVTAEQKEQWEAFSIQNDTWVAESLAIQRADANYHGVPVVNNLTDSSYEEMVLDTIHYRHQPVTGPGPFLPTWTCYPVLPTKRWSPYNWDAASFAPVAATLDTLFEKRQAVVRIVNLPNEPGGADGLNAWASGYIDKSFDESEPMVEVLYPISTSTLQSVTQRMLPPTTATKDDGGDDAGSSSSSVVGMQLAKIYWRSLIQDALPRGSGGITAVFEIADRIFTYQIDGQDVQYLGQGDHHATEYDDYLEQESTFLEDVIANQKGGTLYTGLPLDEIALASRIRVYPSTQMKSHFVSNDPILYAVVPVLIFAFCALVFILYDKMRSQALRKVTYTAVQSTANVAWLEEKVRERTLELETTNTMLEDANRKLLQASQNQLKFFACMAHELRTPLNCVIGVASLLKDSDLNPMQAESMKMISSSSELLLTIVDDVLDYSRLESGNVEVHVQRSNLQETLSSAVNTMNLKGATRNVRVHTFFHPNVPEFINTDARRLSQVLLNLLGNAVKFSRPGQPVEFTVSICQVEESLPLQLQARRYSPPRVYQGQALPELQGRVIRFVVKDYGRGINQGDYQKIFQPFLQADLSVENMYGGTGLGLSITSKLVHGLGGAVSVESVEGEWSAFQVDLPFNNETPVDTDAISLDLQNSSIKLVGIGSVERKRLADVFSTLKVQCACFDDLHSVVSADIASSSATLSESDDRTAVFLVNETVYDAKTFDLLSSRCRQTKTLLLTAGPGFRVKEARRHYPSLTQVLPSILLADIVRYVQESGVAPQRKSWIKSDYDDPATTDGKEEEPAPPYQNLRFLIAEDNLVNQKVLSRILKRLGIENVVVVDNGAKAREQEAEEPFDIIFMDLQMPVMGGVEATKHIVARSEVGSHPRAKVIFCTAHALDQFEKESREAGAVGFIAKPCTIQSVQDVLQKVLSVQSQQ